MCQFVRNITIAAATNVIVRYGVLEEVAHAVDEDGLCCGPAEWFKQFVGDESGIEAMRYGWPGTPRNRSAKVSA